MFTSGILPCFNEVLILLIAFLGKPATVNPSILSLSVKAIKLLPIPIVGLPAFSGPAIVLLTKPSECKAKAKKGCPVAINLKAVL